MKIIHEYDDPNDRRQRVQKIENIILNDEICNPNQLNQGFFIERTGGGGIKFVHHTEDEFGNESKLTITLDKFELELLKKELE